jgi:hypothetical protein
MPYFVICPIYAALVAFGLLLGLGLLCSARTRRYAGFILSGTIGTFPGFIIANLLCWVVFFGVAVVLKIPMEHFKDSEIALGMAGIFLIIVLVGGLIVANILGCGSGFLAGCWLFAKIRRRLSNKSVQPTVSAGAATRHSV